MCLKIRWKFLILMLSVTVAPLIVSAFLHHRSMRRLGTQLAEGTRERLVADAHTHLKRIVDDCTHILDRDRSSMLNALKIQAREIETRLAAPRPETHQMFFSSDFDAGRRLPEGMHISEKHQKTDADGNRTPIPVTYDEQVYFVVKGIDPKTIGNDLAKLSSMPEAYEFVYESHPEMMYWQYTSLECGFHTSYPGHGGYPPEYDPRTRKWYQDAKKSNDIVGIVMPEVSTRTVTMTIAAPVHYPDGSFAGVTAIDVPLHTLFRDLNLSPQWGMAAAIVVAPERDDSTGKTRLVIYAHKSYEQSDIEWTKPFELEYLTSPDTEALEQMTTDLLEGRSGVRKMRYRNKEALWAYGVGETFPVIIVPYDKIIAKAIEAENYALSRTVIGLRVTGIILFCVILLVIIIAVLSSNAVTKPILQLARAGQRLARGDFSSRVEINTGDELEDLGKTFNDMGPQLKEGERMRSSLAVAMEIQQHLLPQESPNLKGFDIKAQTVYCDETGGDYYDFIEPTRFNENMLSIAVGDVTGHGIGAALLMASARAVLRSGAALHGFDLGKTMDVVNRHLVEDTNDERFMTMFYALVNNQTNTFQWSSAGHDAALWVQSATGKIEELGNAALPLGIIAEQVYEPSGTVTLQSGDIVAIGTDGIWEAADMGGKMFGKKRFRNTLLTHSKESSQTISRMVMQAIGDFAGDRPQADDITLVIIKAL